MCGILGGFTDSLDKEQISQALNKISYRGPDHNAIFVDNKLFLGHKRLSIIDLDPRSNQPLKNIDEDLVIVFNGEIYNFIILKNLLINSGHRFKTNSDTEVILAAYKEWGTDCFKKFHGMFSIGLYDIRNKTMLLARDRTGEKPLFYFNYDHTFLFASELKALLPLISGDKKVSEKGLLNYLSYGYIPAPDTIYEDIYKLEPGNYLVYDLNQSKIIKKEAYYNIEFNVNAGVKRSEYINQFDEVLDRVSNQITIADVPLGVFLSGGVDSSGVAALLKNKVPDIKAFTIGFDDPQFDETKYAKQVAKHLNINHIVQKVEMNDVETVYSKLVSLYDEPFNDYSFIPTYYVCKEARKHSTVVVSGDGADEVFCGYRKYTRLKKMESIFNAKILTKSIKGFSKFLPDQSDLKRQLYRIGLSEQELMYDLLAIVFKKRELVNILAGSLLNEYHNYDLDAPVSRHLKRLDSGESLLQKLRYLDIKMTLADDMLVKVDRASMINSLEVRPFFLHPEILDFAFNLPEDYLSNRNEGKIFLKQYLEKYLPPEILYRTKMGFGIPLNKWLVNDLKFLFEEAIKNLPEDLFNKDGIKKILDLHAKGGRDFIMQIHSLFFLGMWFKINT